ncbi:MAG TPA: RraA family protein [Terrimicrobiaceae bacterium]|mgnify:CR=1 FL=1|nr:RraA family protein [Terrimicrobiaceae bacterium]
MSQTTILPQNGSHRPAVDRPFPSSANLSDALGQLGCKFQTLHARIRPITGLPVWGPAYTVQCYPGATHAVEEALEKAAPGDVLVVNGEAFTGAVLLGGLMSGRARQRGLAGAVVDGAVRDVAELKNLRWPVYAAGITPRSGTFDKLGQQQTSVSCGDVVIHAGDLIAGDEDGVVAIPSRMLDAALQLAWDIEQKEAFIARALENGLSLPEAVREYQARGR